MEHIAKSGSAHTDAIVTEIRDKAQRFLPQRFDRARSWSRLVYVAFADGFELRLGRPEGAFPRPKLHARAGGAGRLT